MIRIVTDQGISGYGQAESRKPYLKPMVLFYKDYILGEDPTDVERVLLKIRRLGAFKPWGSAVSAIEIALWDIAGQVAGVPVYKLLGGKIRDRVRIYNGGVRPAMTGQTPQDYAENTAKMKESKEGFTLIKQAVGFHNPAMMRAMTNGWYDEPRTGASHPDRGLMTERGLKHVIACVEAMKKVLGDEIGLALDCGPGWTVKDAITFARAMEPLPHHLARRPDHRRLHALYQRRSLPRSHAEHFDPDPHRRTDLPSPELQGPDREAGRQRGRPRPGRRRRHLRS